MYIIWSLQNFARCSVIVQIYMEKRETHHQIMHEALIEKRGKMAQNLKGKLIECATSLYRFPRARTRLGHAATWIID